MYYELFIRSAVDADWRREPTTYLDIEKAYKDGYEAMNYPRNNYDFEVRDAHTGRRVLSTEVPW